MTAAPLPVLGRCASCAPGRLANDLPGLLAVAGWGWWLGCAVPSALNCPGRVLRVQGRAARGRLATLDTSAPAQGIGTYQGDGGEVGHRQQARIAVAGKPQVSA